MPKGDKILAQEYNDWWTTLNTIRTSWDAPGSTVTPVSVSTGTKATADNMNSLINQVNALATFYSGADWTNFTESTKTAGQKIEYPDKMVYMLDYLSEVCNFCSVESVCSDDSTYTNNSTNSTFGNDGVASDSVETVQSVQSHDGHNTVDSTFGNDSHNEKFTTNHTEDSGESRRFSQTNQQTNNGTCTAFTGF